MDGFRHALRRFLGWWWQGLAASLPIALRTNLQHRGSILKLAVGADGIRAAHAWHGRGGDWVELSSGAGRKLLANLAPDQTAVTVAVEPKMALIEEIDLPAAARSNLRQVLAFSMHKFTPFSADDVYYDYAAIASNDQTIRIRVAVVQKKVVERIFEGLPGWRLESAPESVFAQPKQDGQAVLRFRDARYRFWRMSKMRAALLAANLFLVGAALAIPYAQSHRHLSELQVQLEETLASMEGSMETRRRIEDIRMQTDFLAKRTDRHVGALALLEELAFMIPDSTWLQRLELADGEMHLHGYSSEATALLALLQHSDLFAEARFASPVTREDMPEHDRFHIIMKTTQTGAK